ncbi:MAG: type II secretion system F family protein [Patescibacteria group bacterium]
MTNSIFKKELSFGGVSLEQKAVLARQLAVMLQSGLNLSEALGTALNSSQGKLKQVLGEVRLAVESGRPLATALGDYPKVFGGLFLSSVYAGEASGSLADNLKNVAVALEKERAIVSKVKGALIYPAIVLIATLVLGIILAFTVLPKITRLFEGLNITLPATTRALISFAHFADDWGVVAFPAALIIIFLLVFAWRLRVFQPITHKILLTLPLAKSLVRESNVSRFAGTLAMLLKSGVPVDEALKIASETASNFYFKKALVEVGESARRGAKLATSLAAYPKLFPTLATDLVRVGEESGKFEETLTYIAEFYEAEVDKTTKNISTTIEPALLLFIGLIVAVFALSIITPIYELTGNIKR